MLRDDRLAKTGQISSGPGENAPGRESKLTLTQDDGRENVNARADAFGVDLLVNDAGVGRYGPVLENDAVAERAAVQVNVVATADLTRRLLSGMIDRAGATKRCAGVIKVATTLAFLPLPFLASYTASKMFVLMYTEALAAEGRHEPVDLITLCPGPPRTAFGRRPGSRSAASPAPSSRRSWPARRSTRWASARSMSWAQSHALSSTPV